MRIPGKCLSAFKPHFKHEYIDGDVYNGNEYARGASPFPDHLIKPLWETFSGLNNMKGIHVQNSAKSFTYLTRPKFVTGVEISVEM